MIDIDEVSLKILTDWNSREYNCEGQKQASLQCLINTALEEQQNQITKLEKVLREILPIAQRDHRFIDELKTINKAHRALAELDN